ncbi:MAG: hypothetical protein IJ594_10985 [Oscillospiraceae bacterium]|nr:hypothetical protein [Oscillospiraceae bacterium]
MADYRDIITGTISNLVGKAKEFAQSETVTQLVDKVKDTAENSSVREIYAQGAGRAKSYGRIAKMNLEINGENQELTRVFTEIGKLYYEQAKDAPEGFFASLFAQAEALSESIAAKEAEIEALKEELAPAEVVDADIEVEIGDFEDVVNATEEDGSADKDN